MRKKNRHSWGLSIHCSLKIHPLEQVQNQSAKWDKTGYKAQKWRIKHNKTGYKAQKWRIKLNKTGYKAQKWRIKHKKTGYKAQKWRIKHICFMYQDKRTNNSWRVVTYEGVQGRIRGNPSHLVDGFKWEDVFIVVRASQCAAGAAACAQVSRREGRRTAWTRDRKRS